MEIKLIKPHKKQKEIIDYCLDESKLFFVGVIGRQFGKTMMALNLAIYWALNNKRVIVYWISPTDSQSQKVYKEIINAIYESGTIKSNKQSRGDTEIVFKNNSKILFRSAASEDSLRGPSVDYMILDEAAFIKRETVESIILPMLTVRGKKCIFITTPKGKNYIYDYFLKGLGNDNNWKSVRYSSYDSPLANKYIIDNFRNTLPPKLFDQEINAEFVDSASVFNNLEDVFCLSEVNEPQNGESYYAGIDIGLVNDATVLSIIDSEGNVIKYYRWQEIESPKLINEIIRINNIWKFNNIMIENNNQGLPIYQELKTKIFNISQFNTNSKTKPEIINRLVHLFNMKEIKIIKDDYLKIEFESFIFKQNDSGNIKFLAENGFHDDCVMSIAIARYCYENKLPKKTPFYIG